MTLTTDLATHDMNQMIPLTSPKLAPVAEIDVRFINEDDQNPQNKITSATLQFFSDTSTLPALPATLERLAVHQLLTSPSAFSLPLELNHLQHLSLRGFHFQNSQMLAIPKETPLKFLELVDCSTFRLENANIDEIRLVDCEKVFLTKLPKIALKVTNVKFCMFAGSNIPATLKELRLENMGANKIALPYNLSVFVTKNVRCKSLHLGSKPYAPSLTKEQLDLEKIAIEWKASEEDSNLWSHLTSKSS